MTKNGSFGPITQSISTGGDAKNITQGAGHGWTVTNGGNDVGWALREIQRELAAQSKPAGLMDAVVKGASEAEPDKPVIRRQLIEALEIAKTGMNWVELYDKLKPQIEVAANWLGGEWTSLLHR